MKTFRQLYGMFGLTGNPEMISMLVVEDPIIDAHPGKIVSVSPYA